MAFKNRDEVLELASEDSDWQIEVWHPLNDKIGTCLDEMLVKVSKGVLRNFVDTWERSPYDVAGVVRKVRSVATVRFVDADER